MKEQIIKLRMKLNFTSKRLTRTSTSNVRFSESQRTPFSNSVLFPNIARLAQKESCETDIEQPLRECFQFCITYLDKDSTSVTADPL